MKIIYFYLHHHRLSADEALDFVWHKLRHQLNKEEVRRVFDLATAGDEAHIPMVRQTGLEWLTETYQ